MRGFTLFELLLVISLMGLLSLMAAPRIGAWIDAGAVRNETVRVVAALDAARGAGMRLGQAALTLDDSAYAVVAVVGADTVTAWRATGAAFRGVQISGSRTPITFGASGIATGASNRTLTLSKGAVTARVIVSRLGRLTY